MSVSVVYIARVLVFYICVQVAICQDPTVLIRGTTFTGKHGEVDFQGTTKTYRMFKGIPYAQPPLGDLRFRKPEKLVKDLPSPYAATEYGDGCLQPTPGDKYEMFVPKKQSEDCLFLNVFVPEERPDTDTGHAVMVFIHGGAYVVGSGQIGAEYLASYGNVILVTLNYRLGAFGFLGTGDESGPGNLGLWDQQLALQWVHNNIGSFGGDNQRVTIFGESAGAASVHFQALYPKNKGLFQRVIAESGTPGLKFLFLYDLQAPLKNYGDLMDCKGETPSELMKCLRDTPAETITQVIDKLNKERALLDTRAFPYFDNDFITVDPLKIADVTSDGDNEAVAFYRSLDMINGINNKEGLGMLSPTYLPAVEDPETFKPSRKVMDTEIIPTVLGIVNEPLEEPLLGMVSAMYRDWSDPDRPESIRDQAVNLIGDLMMGVNNVEYSQLHVNTTSNTNSYVYLFSPTSTNPIVGSPSWASGAAHVEELGFVFFFRCFGEQLPNSDWEYELSYDVMTYWSNFAKSGNPNEPVPAKVEWSKYDMTEQSYLVLDKDMKEEYRKKYFYAREADFWLNTIPSLKRALNKDKGVPRGSCSAGGECP